MHAECKGYFDDKTGIYIIISRRSGVDQPGSDRMTGERGKGGPESQPPPLRVSEWGGTQYVPPVSVVFFT